MATQQTLATSTAKKVWLLPAKLELDANANWRYQMTYLVDSYPFLEFLGFEGKKRAKHGFYRMTAPPGWKVLGSNTLEDWTSILDETERRLFWIRIPEDEAPYIELDMDC